MYSVDGFQLAHEFCCLWLPGVFPCPSETRIAESLMAMRQLDIFSACNVAK